MTNNKMNQSPSKGSPGVRMLPVVRIDGKLYFVDHRLRELRYVRNPHERLPISRALRLPYLDIKPHELPPPIIHEEGDDPSSHYLRPAADWVAPAGQGRRQQAEDGILFICIVCKRPLSRYDMEHNLAQCYSCRNPRVIGPVPLEIRPLPVEEPIPSQYRRRPAWNAWRA